MSEVKPGAVPPGATHYDHDQFEPLRTADGDWTMVHKVYRVGMGGRHATRLAAVEANKQFFANGPRVCWSSGDPMAWWDEAGVLHDPKESDR